ncbi:YodC family protein [Novosphingobium resinovorum]|uniref:YodC family protein n=1 Tax=Novosphingobium resinovorum TaxID=158500 RepID=UPI0009F464F3|nr:DUF2158 domain-containing protein [Novosphingobium resinovorum]
MAFKKGDVVQLKSGGPKMTVDAVTGSTTIRVVWFAGSKMEMKHVDKDSIQTYSEPEKK